MAGSSPAGPTSAPSGTSAAPEQAARGSGKGEWGEATEWSPFPPFSSAPGGLAQLGERLPCTQEVRGSNPLASTSPRPCSPRTGIPLGPGSALPPLGLGRRGAASGTPTAASPTGPAAPAAGGGRQGRCGPYTGQPRTADRLDAGAWEGVESSWLVSRTRGRFGGRGSRAKRPVRGWRAGRWREEKGRA